MNKYRFSIFVWFLFRPSLYKQFFREAVSFMKRKEHPTLSYSEESLSWCQTNACDEENALLQINPSWSFLDFNHEFPLLVSDVLNSLRVLILTGGDKGIYRSTIH